MMGILTDVRVSSGREIDVELRTKSAIVYIAETDFEIDYDEIQDAIEALTFALANRRDRSIPDAGRREE